MKYALGLSLEGRELKTALISGRGKQFSIEFLHSFSLDSGDLDPLKFYAPIVKGKRLKTISALPSSDVVLRDLKLPMASERKILAVLPFQAETLIPFPPEETLLFTTILKKPNKTSHVFITATKKEKLSSHLASLQNLHLDPAQVSTSFHALARWAFLHPSEASCRKVAYLSHAESFFLLMEKERIITAKVLSSPSAAEIKKADEYLLSKFPESKDAPWLFAGDSSPEASSDAERPFALAIGLGLEALASDAMSIEWRQGIFSPQAEQRKLKKFALTGAAAFLFTAILLGPVGHMFASRHESDLFKRAQNCLEQIATGKKVLPSDLESACLALEKSMSHLRKEEKLGAFAPKAAEVLAWLSAASEEESEPASLTSLQYLLQPDGKVDMRIILQATPSAAESFLKKLRQGDSLADPEREIVWKKEKKSTYSAQFTLK